MVIGDYLEKVSLLDLPESEVAIQFNDNYAREFFTNARQTSKIDEIFLSLRLKSCKQLLRRYVHNRGSYQLSLVKRILNEMQEKVAASDIEKNVISIVSYARAKGGGKPSRSIQNPRLPFVLNLATSRLIGHMLGDGDVHISGAIRYTNSRKELANSFINDLNILGKVYHNVTFDSGAYRVHGPKIVKLILDKLGLEDKTHTFILHSSKENQIAFVQALFDDEGSVNISGLRISIHSSNKRLLEIIQTILKNIGMISRISKRKEFFSRRGEKRDMWVLEISGLKNFRMFYKYIKSQHNEKRNKLKMLLKFYKGKKERRLRNELRPQIIDMLTLSPRSPLAKAGG